MTSNCFKCQYFYVKRGTYEYKCNHGRIHLPKMNCPYYAPYPEIKNTKV